MNEREIRLHDPSRGREFPVTIWHAGEDDPLIVFSHAALQGRRSATYLCEHLANHGYTVAAMDHSEVVDPKLGRREGEAEEEKFRRWHDVIDSRVPDVRLLLDHLGAERAGICGHSLGGWTALACAESDDRIASVVALAPAGASNPRPGVLPATLSYRWRRDVPVLIVAAENDTSLPLAGIREMYERIPSTKTLVLLERADHAHFLDNVEQTHESFRTMKVSGDLAAIQKEMRPIAELLSGEEAHRRICELTLAHFDATLQRSSIK